MTCHEKAKKIWKRAEWIDGEGRHASLAHCVDLTIQLYKSMEEVEKAKEAIDRMGCGGGCYKDHAVVDIDRVLMDENRKRYPWRELEPGRSMKLIRAIDLMQMTEEELEEAEVRKCRNI